MRTEVEGYLRSYIDELKSRADKLLKCEIPKLTKEAYLSYFETGNRLVFEKQYFARREQLTVFALSVVLEKDIDSVFHERTEHEAGVYAKRLLEVIKKVIEEPTWVLPAHGSRKHLNGEAQSIDLFAAETAGSIAEILYLIKNNRFIKERYCKKYESLCSLFLTEVRTRIFDVFFAKNPCDWWENARMNWTSVCAGNIVVCAYYLRLLTNQSVHIEGTDECNTKNDILTENEYTEILNRATASMVCYLSGMESDGVCTEGCGYYKYGMQYFLKAYELLNNEKNTENIKKIGDFREIALFLQRVYLGNGNCVNFSDCSIKNKMNMGMVCYLSEIYDEVRLNRDFFEKSDNSKNDDKNILKSDFDIMEILGGEECHRWLPAYSDYIWVKEYGGNIRKEDENATVLYPNSMWYIRKENDNTAFYIKGGHNAESHNHNDVGSFAYIVNGEEMLCDLGVGEYTKEYFGDNRYDILCTGSKGHNVPVIAGNYQRAGQTSCADEFIADDNEVSVSFLKAYCDEAGINQEKNKSILKRKIKFTNGEFLLSDTFEIQALYGKSSIITENLVSRIKPEADGNKVFIRGKNAGISIEYLNGDDVKIYIEEKEHKEHNGDMSTVYLIKADYINNEAIYVIDIKIKKI